MIRPQQGVPFLWADKQVLREIRTKVENPASAIAVYLGLCELGSDASSDEFTASQTAIALSSGVSVRTAGTRLQDLRTIKVIEITSPKLDAPATIKLLPFRGAPKLGNGCRALRNDCRALGNEMGNPLQSSIVEERKKESGPVTPGVRFTLNDKLKTLRVQHDDMKRAGLLDQQDPGFKERKTKKAEEIAEIERRLA